MLLLIIKPLLPGPMCIPPQSPSLLVTLLTLPVGYLHLLLAEVLTIHPRHVQSCKTTSLILAQEFLFLPRGFCPFLKNAHTTPGKQNHKMLPLPQPLIYVDHLYCVPSYSSPSPWRPCSSPYPLLLLL